MQFEVPQFIEIEDKIFGPLSWRQFLYLGGGLGGAVAIFLTLGIIAFVLIGLPLAILAGALAFYPVNNRPFSFFLEAIVSYLKGNKLYLWRRNQEVVHKQSFLPKQIPNSPLINNSAEAAGKNISSLARRLELEALQKKE